MYNNQVFAQGTHSVLLATWSLRMETPLVIRNGEKLVYSTGDTDKSRGQALSLEWQQPQDRQLQVAALYDGYEVKNGGVESYHFVPPSSVRGALRSWVIRHMVPTHFLEMLKPLANASMDSDEKKNQLAEIQAERLMQVLAESKNGFQLIASLFGLAIDTKSGPSLASNAGRFRIETDKFAGANMRKVDAAGAEMAATHGPDNVNRQMTVRNPLDRITHASRDKGLHHFLEFSRGTTFTVRLKFLNVQPSDLGLLSLWSREIGNGMLRFGALSSIGRGRLSIQSQSYTLWRRPNAPTLLGLEKIPPCDVAEDGDILENLWLRYEVGQESLASFEESLNEHVWEH